MPAHRDPAPDPNTVNDEASFLAFVRTLAEDRRLATALEEADADGFGAYRGWQVSTVEQFLESAVAWAEATDFARRQELPDTVSPWRRMATFLYWGKLHE